MDGPPLVSVPWAVQQTADHHDASALRGAIYLHPMPATLNSDLPAGGLGVGVGGGGETHRRCGICQKRAMYGIPLERLLPHQFLPGALDLIAIIEEAETSQVDTCRHPHWTSCKDANNTGAYTRSQPSLTPTAPNRTRVLAAIYRCPGGGEGRTPGGSGGSCSAASVIQQV